MEKVRQWHSGRVNKKVNSRSNCFPRRRSPFCRLNLFRGAKIDHSAHRDWGGNFHKSYLHEDPCASELPTETLVFLRRQSYVFCDRIAQMFDAGLRSHLAIQAIVREIGLNPIDLTHGDSSFQIALLDYADAEEGECSMSFKLRFWKLPGIGASEGRVHRRQKRAGEFSQQRFLEALRF